MQISEKHLKKFQELYKEHFGKNLSKQEALENCTKLLRLVELTDKPITKEEFEMLQRRREELGLPKLEIKSKIKNAE